MRQFVRARASLGQDWTKKLYLGEQTVLYGKTVARTLHRTEVVCVGQKNVFRIQKDHRIEGVVGVQTLMVIAVANHLAALSMEKARRVVQLPERESHG